jgi:hypothetical protein
LFCLFTGVEKLSPYSPAVKFTTLPKARQSMKTIYLGKNSFSLLPIIPDICLGKNFFPLLPVIPESTVPWCEAVPLFE